ncbi:MAG: hypothetical protein K8T20_02815, partial [Planctomycetes bacterium]|nr:hypothetical protein [Planctomycetota bacterium]
MAQPGDVDARNLDSGPITPGFAGPSRSRTGWSVLIFAVYAVVTLAMIPFHEPWRDEAQSWLIARDLGPGGIVHQMGYEGTPAL